jgi:hypothetical protein
MRTDVKIGLALGAVFLVIAVAYYGTKKDDGIQLTDGGDALLDELIAGKSPDSKSDSRKPASKTTDKSKPDASRTASADKRKDRATPTNKRQTTKSDRGQTSKTVAQRNPQQNKSSNAAAKRKTAAGSKNVPEGFESRNARAGGTGKKTPKNTRAANGKTTRRTTPPAAKELPRQKQPGSRNATQAPAANDVVSNRPQIGDKTTRARTGQANPKSKNPRSNQSPRTAQRNSPKTSKASAKTRTHVVSDGESFAVLADHYYGSQKYTWVLVEANPEVDPRRMRLGAKLVIPKRPGAEPKVASKARSAASTKKPSSSSKSYTVASGDTFYGIASRMLGDGSRWPELYELNKTTVGGNPDRLKLGMVLQLPK